MCCRDAPPLLCCCRQSMTLSESGHPCASAAGKLSLTADQVSRGLLYRQHVLGVLDRYSPEACLCAVIIPWQSCLGPLWLLLSCRCAETLSLIA